MTHPQNGETSTVTTAVEPDYHGRKFQNKFVEITSLHMLLYYAKFLSLLRQNYIFFFTGSSLPRR